MPTITLSKKELLKATGKLSDEKLKHTISMLGTDIEGINGDEITVEIFPNRPDLLSQQGLGRALAAYLGKQPGLRTYDVTPSGERIIVDKSVVRCRPHTSCAIIRGLTITEERLKQIIQIQEKLHVTFGRDRKRAAIGIYPLEHIAFPVRFIGLQPSEISFVPLEMRREMTGDEILEIHPKGKAYAHLMDGLERYACFIDAEDEILSMTPIINSERTGRITTQTRDLFVECSGFDERILDECLAIIVTALGDMGGRIESLTLEYPKRRRTTPDLTPSRMPLDDAYINRLLGLRLTKQEMVDLLGRMGIGSGKGVLIPAYRTDIMHQADLAEEVAIAYGYDKLPEALPNVATNGSEDPTNQLLNLIRDVLANHGLMETLNYNLINTNVQTGMMRRELQVIKLASSVSETHDSLRADILPALLDTLRRNQRHEYPQKLFEVGKVFSTQEEFRIAAILCGETADYTAIRQLLDSLLLALGDEGAYEESEDPAFISGRVAEVTGKTFSGLVGEVHPEVLTNFGLTMPAAAFELRLR